MALAAENANSKLVDVVAVADVDVNDVKERVNNSLRVLLLLPLWQCLSLIKGKKGFIEISDI